MALVLAAIGLLGVVAQGVLQRTRELAVRLALGATPTNLVELVIGEGMRLALLGVTIGGFAAIGAWRIIGSQVAGVALIDARGGVLAGGALLFVMLAASYLPARRASRLDPAATLRAD
jgi:ABC-type antimicrobial peptide transport system permease subunit